MAFNYFTYGAACSEVEIDCLTGDHQVIRSDIVMDLGSSLNPAIDIGQIEGINSIFITFCDHKNIWKMDFPIISFIAKIQVASCKVTAYSHSKK